MVDDQLANIDSDVNPKLVVSVKIGKNRTEPIIIYEGDDAVELAEEFCTTHGLDMSMREKLIPLLEDQISTVLSRIPEGELEEDNDSKR